MKRVIEYLLWLWRREHWWAEFWSAVAAMLWAKFDIFSHDNIDGNERYYVLLSMVPKSVLDAIVLTTGLSQMLFLLWDVRLGRLGAAFFMCALYCMFTISIIWAESGAPPPGMAWTIGYIGMNGFALAQLARRSK